MSLSKEQIREQKSQLRKALLHERSEFKKQARQSDLALCENLKQGLAPLRSAEGVWIAYRAIRTEADPQLAVSKLKGRWAFPKVAGHEIGFFLTNEATSWVQGSFGIFEPDSLTSKEINIHQAEGILVPGVGFDKRGSRLGYGRGFYDRALKGFKGHKVGVAYSVQLAEALPADEHDIRMNFIATENDFFVVEGN